MRLNAPMTLGLGRRYSPGLSAGAVLLADAEHYWNAADWTSGDWLDRNQSAVATVTDGTKIASGATYADAGAVTRTAPKALIYMDGTGSMVQLPSAAIPPLNGSTDQATVLLVMVPHETGTASFDRYYHAGNHGGAFPGINFQRHQAGVNVLVQVRDNAATQEWTAPFTANTLTGIAGIVKNNDTLTPWASGSGLQSAVSTAALGDMTSAVAPRIGSLSTANANNAEMGLVAFAWWTRPLTADELDDVMEAI